MKDKPDVMDEMASMEGVLWDSDIVIGVTRETGMIRVYVDRQLIGLVEKFNLHASADEESPVFVISRHVADDEAAKFLRSLPYVDYQVAEPEYKPTDIGPFLPEDNNLESICAETDELSGNVCGPAVDMYSNLPVDIPLYLQTNDEWARSMVDEEALIRGIYVDGVNPGIDDVVGVATPMYSGIDEKSLVVKVDGSEIVWARLHQKLSEGIGHSEIRFADRNLIGKTALLSYRCKGGLLDRGNK